MTLPRLALLLVLAASTAGAADRIDLRAGAAMLDLENAERTGVGRLAWRGGLVLSSADRRFGGYSGLEILDDGRTLLAVSDEGHWFTASIGYGVDGHLAGLTQGRIAPLLGTDGKAVTSKRTSDAEALRRLSDGSYLVAFERDHRIARFRSGRDGLPLDGAAEPVPTPPGIAAQPGNGGLETMAVLADGRLLLLSEEGRTPDGHAKAWLRDAAGQWHDLTYRLTQPFVPVDATTLPDGRLLVLERRYHPVGGVGARLMLLDAASVGPGALLAGEEVANLAAPLNIDNFEAVAVRRGPNGETLVYLVSDDNLSPLQRTLLFLFELRPTGPDTSGP